MTDEYTRFIEGTGLHISRATFYRIKRDLKTGGVEKRLSKMLLRESLPPGTKIATSTEYILSEESQRMAYSTYRAHKNERYNPDTVPFMSFDGEGRTINGVHKYVLLKCSDGTDIYNENGLSTVECLNFLLSKKEPKSIRIWYSFGYDVSMILRDLPDRLLYDIMHGTPRRWGPYKISYLNRKIFSINNLRFYDVFNYWQTSFISAITQSFGKEAISDGLRKGKESRSDFADWSIEDIRRYTAEELQLLLRLADHLRSVLLKVDIHLGSSFYGPGSIANYWFKRYNINPPRITDPIILDRMERAYFGGRFETFKLGKVEPIYEYDINSAYPAIIAGLPYLDEWTRTNGTSYWEAPTWSIWHIEFHYANVMVGPFPSRDRKGLISYPSHGRGWYWKPEIEAAISLYGKESIEIIEGICPTVIQGKPFEWVKEVYAQRLALKKEHDPAQWGLKVGLNSLYGKTAQRVGSAKYFSLAWAGYITSATRAKLLTAIQGQEFSCVATATDAVYLTARNNSIPTGSALGDWEFKRWDRGYFIQSGVYRLERKATKNDPPETVHNGLVIKDAYRGFAVKNGIADIIQQIEDRPFQSPSIYQTKFISHIEAIKCPKALGPYRCSFVAVKKTLEPYKTTKRKCLDEDTWFFIDLDVSSDFGKPLGSIVRNGTTYYIYRAFGELVRRSIETSILDNHNDHSDYLHIETGDLEESYPFHSHTSKEDEITMASEEGTAVERIGGAHGILTIDQVRNLPIVDEQDILKELSVG